MRISEALALEERDLDRRERKIVIRNGKGGKRRLVLMDDWGWVEFERWLEIRRTLPPGQIFCVLSGSTIGRAMHDSAVRDQFRDVGERAKLRRRFHPHALRHAAATEWWRENIGLMSVMTQLGHAHPGVTIAYLRSIVDTEMLEPIGNRKPPMVMISV
jgi:integrase